MGLTLLATALFLAMTFFRPLHFLGYEVEPIHLRPFICCYHEPCPIFGYGRGTRIYESVFHHGSGHFSEQQVLSALCSVCLAADGVFTELIAACAYLLPSLASPFLISARAYLLVRRCPRFVP